MSTAANKGVKQGLPAFGLPSAEDAATKLWGVARLGTAAPEAFARQFGERAKASGSTWDTRIALLRGLKLVRQEEKNIGLSALGLQLVDKSNPQGQRAARRAAVLNLKAYRELVEAFNGEILPEMDALATKLQFEYGKTEEFAKRAAKAFVESLEHAEMLGAGNVVLKDGNLPAEPSHQPAFEQDDRAGDEAEAKADAEIDAAFDSEEDGAGDALERASDDDRHGTAVPPNVTLSMTLDLSRFRADEVVQIISALGLGRRV